MADLGSVGQFYSYKTQTVYSNLVNLNHSFFNGKPTIGLYPSELYGPFNTKTLSGQVNNISGPVINCPVILLNRDTRRLVMQTVTNINGNYSFNYLAGNSGLFIVFALDTTKTYNIPIKDNLTAGS